MDTIRPLTGCMQSGRYNGLYVQDAFHWLNIMSKRLSDLISTLTLVSAVFVSSAWAAETQGELIATQGASGAPACNSCHALNKDGRTNAAYPRLAGQPEAYLEKQLHDFKTGSRTSAVMEPFVKGLNDAQIKAVAAYFASASVRFEAPPNEVQTMTGAALATRGKWSRDVPACDACHGPGGQGVPPHFPALAGQPAAYISGQLHAWRNGGRKNDPQGLMKAVATRLSDEDINSVSAYFQNMKIKGN